jgi:hypothetical protein
MPITLGKTVIMRWLPWLPALKSATLYGAYIALMSAPAFGIGPWTIPGAEILVLGAAAVGIFAFVSAFIAYLFGRPTAGRKLTLTAAAAALLFVPVVLVAGKLRLAAFGLVAERSEPLVQAIQRYEKDSGRPPATLEALLPRHLAALPLGIPPYRVLAGDEARNRCSGSRWILIADVGTGILNWDEFLYTEAKAGEKCGFTSSRRSLGSWFYYHE